MPNPLYNDGELVRVSGKPGARDDEGTRTAFRKDYARLLHAPSFRRLQGKTQLFPSSESDFFRNRLTHSLEVAQIAKGIAASLNQGDIGVFAGAKIDEDLVEFASIAHDLGHPPFGHNGEHALDELMADAGGFEGNAQTLRILAVVERKLVDMGGQTLRNDVGLDLTLRSLASVLKYDQKIPTDRGDDKSLVKGYYEAEAALVTRVKSAVAPEFPPEQSFKTIECSIMDIADDIAYSTYDLEDSLHAGFVTPMALVDAMANQSIQEKVLARTNKALRASGYEAIENSAELIHILIDVFDIKMPEFNEQGDGIDDSEKALLTNLVSWQNDNRFITESLDRTQLTAERVGRLIRAVELVPNYDFPQLSTVRLRRDELLQVEVFKHLNFEVVIRSSRLAVVEYRGKDIVSKLFGALINSDGSLLPDDWKKIYAEAGSEKEKKRTICDYVACMTDRYAVELYERLFGQGTTMFKPL